MDFKILRINGLKRCLHKERRCHLEKSHRSDEIMGVDFSVPAKNGNAVYIPLNSSVDGNMCLQTNINYEIMIPLDNFIMRNSFSLNMQCSDKCLIYDDLSLN